MAEQENLVKKLFARVEGRVQGVGFRYFVAKKAEELGLKTEFVGCEVGMVAANIAFRF